MVENPYSCLRDALESKGRSLNDRIILIGSRASGCARPDSDWDFLCVTTDVQKILHDSTKSPVQVILVHPYYIHETELGVHAASHGIGITTSVPRKETLDIPLATKALRRRTLSAVRRLLAPRTLSVGFIRNERARLLLDCIRLRSAWGRTIPPNARVIETAEGMSEIEEAHLYVECLGLSLKVAEGLSNSRRT